MARTTKQPFKMTVKQLTKERKKWMRKIRPWYSKFIRLRDCDEYGMVTCVTCGERFHWKRVHAGHYVHGLHLVEGNEHGQCAGCNTYASKGAEYGLWMCKEYGIDFTDSLFRMKHTQKKHDVDELKEIYDLYKKKAHAMANEKGQEI